MDKANTRLLLLAAMALMPAAMRSQAAHKEPIAILELGAATSQGLKAEGQSFGPSFAVEFTPIENWLELEAGVAPLFARHSIVWNTGLLFKKPWTLSPKAEFMFGVGPEWVHSRENGTNSNSLAGEAALDFMFWPGRKRKCGWYLEPAYDYGFSKGHEQSVGISFGVLIAIP